MPYTRRWIRRYVRATVHVTGAVALTAVMGYGLLQLVALTIGS